MPFSMVAAVLGTLIVGAGSSDSVFSSALAADTFHIKLDHLCGNTLRARDHNGASVTVTWDVVGTAEQGTLLLPPKPVGEGFSATLFTPQYVGAVRLLYQGQVLQTKASEGEPPCPAEPVGLQPPDTIPAWCYDDTSYAKPGLTLKRIVWIVFQPSATGDQRTSAVMSVGGSVVGGARMEGLEGYYYIELPASTDESGLRDAAASLRALPCVEEAGLEVLGGTPRWIKPSDGIGGQRRPGASGPGWRARYKSRGADPAPWP